MDLHPGEEIIYNGHPSWRSTWALYGRGLLTAIIIALLVGGATAVFGDGANWTLAVIVFVVIACITILVGFVHRMFTIYTITTQRLRIQKGIISRHVQQTRIERVQNVNTDQGILERILQVGDVDFDTAGTTDSDFRFDGVGNPDEVVAAVDRAQRAHSMATSQGGVDPITTDGL
jgi:uncharacterized membrane protein YdbT with pleckstrin-like domain